MTTALTPTPATTPADVYNEVAEAVLAFATCDADAGEVESARVRLIGPNGKVLDLCKHHYETHELALDFAGFTSVIDTRYQLDPTDHPSA